jgi:hypothetical protein
MTARTTSLLIAALVVLGCDDAKDREPSAAPDAAFSGSDQVVGTFNLSLLAPSDADPDGHTSLVGKVYDGPSPAQLVWEVAEEDEECQLLTPHAPFCPERCGASAACVEDGVCQNYPKALNAGTVSVFGVRTTAGDTEFTLEPIANTYQPRAAIKLPFPAFDEGARIRLKARGGELAPFELEARGIAPLELTTNSFVLTRDAPFDLTWNAAAQPAVSRIRVKLDISHHGGSKGMIVCELDDDGAAQLSAAIITQLIDLGAAGFPSVILTRESSRSTGTRVGRVALTIDSKVERYVTLEGLDSCTGNADCPSGKTCQSDLTCQ